MSKIISYAVQILVKASSILKVWFVLGMLVTVSDFEFEVICSSRADPHVLGTTGNFL